jgi:hypothetical protein
MVVSSTHLRMEDVRPANIGGIVFLLYLYSKKITEQMYTTETGLKINSVGLGGSDVIRLII